MDRHDARDLEILTAIAEGRPLSQRALAARLGIALGLVNLYLRRLSRKGYVKITEFGSKPAARKRLRYLLTAKGIGEKTRLTYEHMTYALRLYQRAGWDWVGWHRDAVTEQRVLKPELPEAGAHGIPIRHEIELEYPL